MKISYKWLREYVDTDLTPNELDDLLTFSGLEIEGVEKVETIKGGLEHVVIAQVLTCEPHPDSDHLHVTTVDVGGDAPDGRKVKGTLHWVSAPTAVDAEVRLFDRLFATEAPDEAPEGKTFLDNLNPDSLRVLQGCKLEPSLAEARMGADANGIEEPRRFQFERMGYFCTDPDSTPEHLVFNRSCTLKDSWAKIK